MFYKYIRDMSTDYKTVYDDLIKQTGKQELTNSEFSDAVKSTFSNNTDVEPALQKTIAELTDTTNGVNGTWIQVPWTNTSWSSDTNTTSTVMIFDSPINVQYLKLEILKCSDNMIKKIGPIPKIINLAYPT